MITEKMTIDEVLVKLPKASDVFLRYGLDCMGCQVAEFESIGHACKVYGIHLDTLLKELNDVDK